MSVDAAGVASSLLVGLRASLDSIACLSEVASLATGALVRDTGGALAPCSDDNPVVQFAYASCAALQRLNFTYAVYSRDALPVARIERATLAQLSRTYAL